MCFCYGNVYSNYFGFAMTKCTLGVSNVVHCVLIIETINCALHANNRIEPINYESLVYSETVLSRKWHSFIYINTCCCEHLGGLVCPMGNGA